MNADLPATIARIAVAVAQEQFDKRLALIETIAARPETLDGFDDVIAAGWMSREATICHLLADQFRPLGETLGHLENAKAALATITAKSSPPSGTAAVARRRTRKSAPTATA
jgi:hypothetical protein